jgi:hypothetical protein
VISLIGTDRALRNKCRAGGFPDEGDSVPRKIEDPDRNVSVGLQALKPYMSHDDLWSPSDALALLFDSPAVRLRVGEIIARTKAKSDEDK